jgi:branched-chain amino acid transport system ATP-binding protein
MIAQAALACSARINDVEPDIRSILNSVAKGDSVSKSQIARLKSYAQDADRAYLETEASAPPISANWFSKARLATALANLAGGESWDHSASAAYELCFVGQDKKLSISDVRSAFTSRPPAPATSHIGHPPSDIMLDVKDLHVAYGAIKAIHGVSISVPRGQIVTLIGANGAGKTTTLRAISGMVRASSGSITLNDQNITGLPSHQMVRPPHCMAHAPEGRGIFANMSVEENLDLGAFARPSSDKRAIAEDREKALTLFPRIRERLKQNAGTLSGGEQQMLAIARALMARPSLLLLDEPSLGLAPQIVQTIFKIIRDINAAGTTILLVEQNAHMALNVAHHAYVLETGAITMHGPAKELAASDEVRKAYLGGH